jgi:hypothetical protein
MALASHLLAAAAAAAKTSSAAISGRRDMLVSAWI